MVGRAIARDLYTSTLYVPHMWHSFRGLHAVAVAVDADDDVVHNFQNDGLIIDSYVGTFRCGARDSFAGRSVAVHRQHVDVL